MDRWTIVLCVSRSRRRHPKVRHDRHMVADLTLGRHISLERANRHSLGRQPRTMEDEVDVEALVGFLLVMERRRRLLAVLLAMETVPGARERRRASATDRGTQGPTSRRAAGRRALWRQPRDLSRPHPTGLDRRRWHRGWRRVPRELKVRVRSSFGTCGARSTAARSRGHCRWRRGRRGDEGWARSTIFRGPAPGLVRIGCAAAGGGGSSGSLSRE